MDRKGIVLSPCPFEEYHRNLKFWLGGKREGKINPKTGRRKDRLDRIHEELRRNKPSFVSVKFSLPLDGNLNYEFLDDLSFDSYEGRVALSIVKVPREQYDNFGWEDGFHPDRRFIRYKGVWMPEDVSAA
ncbi:MAG: hypothetical protein HYW25_00335 [Candidatus Aenigmarchaeota archaeon]|nr:hypothetical protein [Candidatus Aenigmarchaeota archaeon]